MTATRYIPLSSIARPIAFHKVFARVSGGACNGLFLSQLWYWHDKGSDPDGWIYKTQTEWEEETTLTRREQETAREALRRIGVLEEVKRGLPARLYYRVNSERLAELINIAADKDGGSGEQGCTETPSKVVQKRQPCLSENAKQECTETPSMVARNRHAITESTTETTSESTTETTSESTAGKSFEEPPNAETKIVAFAPEKKIQVPPSGKIPQAQLSAEFKVFWEAYPSSRRGDKRKTKIEWDKAREGAEFNTIMQGLAKSKQSSQWQEEKFIVHAERFLRGSRWESAETYIPEKSDTSAPGKASRDNSLAENAAYFAQRLLDRQNVRKEAFSHSALIAQ